jgi:hypothetical protein
MRLQNALVRKHLALSVVALILAAACNSSLSDDAVELRYSEHKTVRHPTKKYYVSIWPYGLQVSFENSFGNFATYEFPADAFTADEPSYLLSRGSPDLLPLRATRIAENDFRVEWLEETPSADDVDGPIILSH